MASESLRRLIFMAYRVGKHSQVKPKRTDVGSNAATLMKAMEDILIMADLPEPAEKMQLPMPNVGFTYCSPQAWEGQLRSDAVIDLTNVSPEEFTMEGLISQDGGNWRCRFCERDLFDTEPEKHLNPYYQEGKRHRQYRDMGHNVGKRFRVHGWKLRHERVAISKSMFTRDLCDKKRGLVQCSMKVDTWRPTRTGTSCPLGFRRSLRHPSRRRGTGISRRMTSDQPQAEPSLFTARSVRRCSVLDKESPQFQGGDAVHHNWRMIPCCS